MKTYAVTVSGFGGACVTFRVVAPTKPAAKLAARRLAFRDPRFNGSLRPVVTHCVVVV